MSECRPTTDEVRATFVWGSMNEGPANRADIEAEFDRWLVRVRAEAKAEALREAAERTYSRGIAGWLKTRAAQIEKEANGAEDSRNPAQ